MTVNPFTCANGLHRAADEVTVLSNAQPGGQRAHGKLVPSPDVFLQRDVAGDGAMEYAKTRAAREIHQRRRNVVVSLEPARLLRFGRIVAGSHIHGLLNIRTSRRLLAA